VLARSTPPGCGWRFQTGMVVMGVAAELLPAWLTEFRNGRTAGLHPDLLALPVQATDGGGALQAGLRTSLETAARALEAGDRSRATVALDAARRVGEIGARAAPGSAFAAAQRRPRPGPPPAGERSARGDLGRASTLRPAPTAGVLQWSHRGGPEGAGDR